MRKNKRYIKKKQKEQYKNKKENQIQTMTSKAVMTTTTFKKRSSFNENLTESAKAKDVLLCPFIFKI